MTLVPASDATAGPGKSVPWPSLAASSGRPARHSHPGQDPYDYAGPIVRPYALTGGRTRPVGDSFDLLAQVSTSRGWSPDLPLEPEQAVMLRRCRVPTSVADLAADLDLPLGVIRILLSDLRERGLIMIRRPSATRLTDPQLLREVADGLRRL